MNGKLVSQDDPRFKGKVVLAIVTGTWCPNCHDEAQYLVQLDKKYRDKGLAIVALDFEEPEQQGSLERERAFVKKYGVEYTISLPEPGGDVGEGSANCQFVYLAGDNLCQTGRTSEGGSLWISSPASGQFHSELEQEFTARIEQLLSEKQSQNLAASSIPLPSPENEARIVISKTANQAV